MSNDNMNGRNTSGKKRTTLAVAGMMLCAAVTGGVFAWYSAQASRVNTFTSGGNISTPENKPGNDNGNTNVNSNDPINKNDPNHNQSIVETEWVDNSKITAGSHVPKNPNIGMGAGSDDSYVFAKVDNKLGEHVYFVLDTKYWAPVDGQVTAYDGVANAYTSGIFVYTGGSADNSAAILQGDKDGDVYTGELFKSVVADDSFGGVVSGTGDTLTVKAFFGAASSASEDLSVSYSDIEAQAIAKLNA